MICLARRLLSMAEETVSETVPGLDEKLNHSQTRFGTGLFHSPRYDHKRMRLPKGPEADSREPDVDILTSSHCPGASDVDSDSDSPPHKRQCCVGEAIMDIEIPVYHQQHLE